MAENWDDLSDAELRARLTQRGATPQMADYLVTFRDEPEIAEKIDMSLRLM